MSIHVLSYSYNIVHVLFTSFLFHIVEDQCNTRTHGFYASQPSICAAPLRVVYRKLARGTVQRPSFEIAFLTAYVNDPAAFAPFVAAVVAPMTMLITRESTLMLSADAPMRLL